MKCYRVEKLKKQYIFLDETSISLKCFNNQILHSLLRNKCTKIKIKILYG